MKQECIVYTFSCDLYTYADNVGYTARHLYQCIVEHENLAIRKLLAEAHGQLDNPTHRGPKCKSVKQSLNAKFMKCCL